MTRFDPPRALGMSWRPSARPDVETTIDFTVTPLDGERSRLEVVHAGWEAVPELRPMHDAGWGHFLACLDDLVARRPVEKALA